jgi:hypothetical protein
MSLGVLNMTVFLQDWILLLRDGNSAAGFPLIVGGLGLMLFGWRLWKVCVVLAFGLIGTLIAAQVIGPRDNQMTYALACGMVLGLLSYWPGHFSVAVLGGVIGGGVTHFYLESMNLSSGTLWGGVGAAFVACTAFAVINRRYVVILVTAFLGAMLLLSGLTSWAMNVPGVLGTFRSMAAWSVIVVPFLVLVPTVMSCFYQIAEVRRLQIEF